MRVPPPPDQLPTASPRHLYPAVLEATEECAPGYRRLRYRLDGSLAFRAGQFCMLRGDWGADPLLARPMSILWAQDDLADVVLKVTGRGTTLLSDTRPGSRATLLAPLGRPFTIPDDTQRWSVLIAGGVGVPPIYALARELVGLGRADRTRVFLGGRSSPDVLLADEIASWGVEVVTATEDGSAGTRGRVTAPLEPWLFDIAADGATMFGCGPGGMLKALADLSRRAPATVPYQAAVEQLMACGYGACLGCVMDMVDGTRRLVCTDGPVLNGREVYG